MNINTDTRMLTPVTLTSEYQALEQIFSWGLEELLRMNLMGVYAAFAGEAVKEHLKTKLLQGYTVATPA